MEGKESKLPAVRSIAWLDGGYELMLAWNPPLPENKENNGAKERLGNQHPPAEQSGRLSEEWQQRLKNDDLHENKAKDDTS